MFERIIQENLAFNIKQQISTCQHGFYSGRSTNTNLLLFNNYITENVEKGYQVDAVYTDFSKAFDKINHNILLEKLERFNNNALPIKWIKSYLTGRKQFVKIGAYQSELFDVPSGVPQGSHLGPLLFTLLCNDVTDCFNFATCLMFADDMKIFATIKTVNDRIKFQEDLDRFCGWTVENMMNLNVKKCATITFSKQRCPIESVYNLNSEIVTKVTQIKDLGVTFSADLSFQPHIQKIVSKANSMLGFVKRNTKDFRDPYTLKTLYTALVRSHLEYAVVLWAPHYECHINRIESVQKRFLKYALRQLPSSSSESYHLSSYQGRCMLLGLEQLEKRRSSQRAVFAGDIISGKIDCPQLLQKLCIYAPERPLRNRFELLWVPTRRTNYGQNEAIRSIAVALNSHIDSFDFGQSRNVFKKKLAKKI